MSSPRKTPNLLLCIFNLIPVPPLDGTSIMHFIMSEQSYSKYKSMLRGGGLSILGIFIAWKLIAVIFPPVHSVAINILYPGMYYR